MIEKLDGIITRVVDRDRSRVYEALDSKSIIKAMNKTNELVDHVNRLEDALQEIKKPNENYSDVVKAFDKFGKEFSKELVKETKFGEWVSVKDKLPLLFESVLVVMPGEAPFPIIYQGYVNKQGVWYVNNFLREANEITHWMQMPNPPEEFTKVLIGRGVDK